MKVQVIVNAQVQHTLEVEVPDNLDGEAMMAEAEDMAWAYRTGRCCEVDCEAASDGKVRIVKTETIQWDTVESVCQVRKGGY